MDFWVESVVGSEQNPAPKENETAWRKVLEEYKTSLYPLKNQPIDSKVNLGKKKDLEKLHSHLGWPGSKSKPASDVDLTAPNTDVSDIMKKSILTPVVGKSHVLPPPHISEKRRKQQKRKEAEKTKGPNWFNLPATEMTEEVQKDLEILKMRSVLDPKRFYKKNDLKVLPKYFQIGKVMDSPLEYFSGRITKKERKKTLVDELMADAEFHAYNKRKFREVIQEKQQTQFKEWKKAKKFRKKKQNRV